MTHHLLHLWYRRRAVHPAVRRLFDARWPAGSTDYRSVSYLSVDLEMTDLDPRKGEIVAIGYVPVVRGEIQIGEARSIIIRSARGVGDSATVHGLRDRDVSLGVAVDEALGELLEAMCGRVFLAHHAPVDLAFLNYSCRRLFNVPFLAPVVDTMGLERRRLAMRREHVHAGELRLYRCRERYNLPVYRAHDAVTDALGTAELFLAQTATIAGNGALRLRQLQRWSRLR